MGSEFLLASGEGDQTVTLTLAGDAESLRPRLARALERLGYHVLSDQPLMARRRARGWAVWGCSWNAMEYPTKLTVVLKRQNATTTLVTFDYEVKHPLLTGGDRQTLAREAEAVAALAMQNAATAQCAACGTEALDDSRFCRRCGAPMTVEVAELEVLRLTNGARSGYQQVFTGALGVVLAFIIGLLILLAKSNPRAAVLLFAVFMLPSLLVLLTGLWRLHRTLNAPKEMPRKSFYAAGDAGVLPTPASAVAELPPARAVPFSVTDGTTELLEGGREPAPVRARRKTDEVR